MTIRFFGAADRAGGNDGGRIVSEYPAWYHTTKVEELIREVDRKEKLFKSGLAMDMPNAAELKRDYEIEKERLEHILESRPNLVGKNKDKCWEVYKQLGSMISDSMYTRTDMLKGLADAHEENRRNTKPCMDIGSLKCVQMARDCGINLPKGQTKLSRNQAARMYKILGKTLGENTNVERLRRDENTGTYKPDVPLDEMI